MLGNLYSRYTDELRSFDDDARLRTLPHIQTRCESHLVIADKTLLNLSSNDYLGLGSDISLLQSFFKDAAEPTLDAYGMTASGSRLLTGNHSACTLLENDLATLYGGRAATVFSSGYQANVGICSTLAGKSDLILADKLCHASLIDGIRLSGAKLVRYRHLDYEHLESLLNKHRTSYDNAFIISESVFSMDGDIADIRRLASLKRDHQAMLMIDEAHAVGVFGDCGLGICERDGLIGEADVIVGTFGKALASFGAFAVTDAVIKNYLINCMRPFIFTTALPPAVVNWSRQTLAQAVTMKKERAHLSHLASQLRSSLQALGIATRGESQIVPVLVGENAAACSLAVSLQEKGFLAPPVRPPTVPVGSSRLRLSLSANMAWDQICGIPNIIAGCLHHDESLDTPQS